MQPGLTTLAKLKRGEYHVDAGVVTLHSPFPEAGPVDYRGTRLDGEKDSFSYRGEVTVDAPISPGRWRLTAAHPQTGEVRWTDVEVKRWSKQEVRFLGRSRQVELTVLDRAGWPHPRETKSDLAGRLAVWPRWQLTGLPTPNAITVQGVKAPIRVEVPAGEGVYRATVEVPIEIKRR